MEHKLISNKSVKKMEKVRNHICDALKIWHEEIDGEDKDEFIARFADRNPFDGENLASILYRLQMKLSEINR